MNKTTLVIGASLNEAKYSNMCVKTLVSGNIPVTAVGLREGVISTIKVATGMPKLKNIHTVTLYLGPKNQKPWYDYIMNLKPKRVVFNPGTENDEFRDMLSSSGVETIEDCTIMMVQYGRY